MEKLWCAVAIGYMLKVIKSGVNLTEFKDEFALIRHGNYSEFVDKVGGKKPFMLIVGGETAFSRLVEAGPSIKKFYNNCKSVYGDVSGEKFSDIFFENLALFELSIRMRANNYGREEYDFEKTIDAICEIENITFDERIKLHKGRQFLNLIKHPDEQKLEKKFGDWKSGAQVFMECDEILEKYAIKII